MENQQLYNYLGNFALGFLDTVRGCFHEGAKIEGMEIYEKTHIQIAIRNMNCIKAVFLPREEQAFPIAMA